MADRFSRRTFIAAATGVLAGVNAPGRTAEGATVAGKSEAERLIEDLRRANREKEAQSAVDEVLRRAVASPADVIASVGEPEAPGLHTLHHSPDLTILNVVWSPLMMLLPHNHNMWASIGIYTGREDNIVWERRGAEVAAVGAASLSEKDVYALPEDAIHSVSNPIGRLTGAIHVYGGDFFAPEGRSEWDPETLRERPFDLEAARERFREANRRFESGR